MDHLCYLCIVLAMLSRLIITVLWSTAEKPVMLNCVCFTFPCGILGQVWYLIVSIPDPCRLSYSLLLSPLLFRYTSDIIQPNRSFSNNI